MQASSSASGSCPILQTKLTATQARMPSVEFNKVVYRGEVLCVERRDGNRVFVISAEDQELLEKAKKQARFERALESTRADHAEALRRLA